MPAKEVIGTAELQDRCVTGDKISDGAIGLRQLAPNLIPGLNPNSKLSGKSIQDYSIPEKALGSGVVSARALAKNAVYSDAISVNAVTTEKVKDGAITLAKLDPDIDFTPLISGLVITPGQILTVTVGGTLGSAAYTDSTAYATAGHNHDLVYLGISAKAADSSKLNGQEASYYALATHNHDLTYLGIAAKAADSDKLNGQSASYYSPSTHNHDLAYLGIAAKAADSDKLNGQTASYYSASTHNHDLTYLGIAATAADSAKLNGQAASYYSASTHNHSGVYLPSAATAADSSKLGGALPAAYQTALGYTAEDVSHKAAASGYASLDGGSKVVQNPTNATATPGASKIPIADANGLLVSWVETWARTTGPYSTVAHAQENITGLSIAVAANGVYAYELLLFVTESNDTAGVKATVNFSGAGAPAKNEMINGTGATGVPLIEQNMSFATCTNTYLVTANGIGAIFIKGVFVNGASAGNLTGTIQKLGVVNSATVQGMSHMKVTRLA